MLESLRIISRNSAMALYQSNYVKQKLNELYPDINLEVCGITTIGDRVVDRPLTQIGGKGLFTEELETFLRNKTYDIAVHSAKDLSVSLEKDFVIAAFLERDDASDAFVSNKYNNLRELPSGAVVGTSSPRRESLLNRYYPHLTVKLLRGNVPTRVNKLDREEYDGIIVATSGLYRLSLQHRIKQRLCENQFIPAIGQGALAIEVLASETHLIEMLKPLNHSDTHITLSTEREVGRILQAGCSVPLAVHAQIKANSIHLQAYLADKISGLHCEFVGYALCPEYLQLADRCAQEMLKQGAQKILQRYT